MPSKKTTARVGAKGAKALVRHPALRKATVRAVRPPAKVTWKVGKTVAKRKARQQAQGFGERFAGLGEQLAGLGEQLEQVGDVARFVGQMAVVYGPPAAEVLGLVEPPKPRRTVPAFLGGLVVGGAVVYFLEPEHGPEHRERVQKLVAPPG